MPRYRFEALEVRPKGNRKEEQMAMGTKVDLAVRDHVATITFHDEKGTNLINTPFMEAIIRVGEEVRQDPSTGLVILTGGGDKAFSAGADIREMAGLDAVTARAFITKLHHVCHLFRTLPVPSIARLKGECWSWRRAATCESAPKRASTACPRSRWACLR
jgi:1,4-dihydroxy-2-naphthoyl-CoA synthase